jgi:hypothetical protein
MNAHRVDLNRDFKVKAAGFEGFAEPESKALADGVAKALGGANLAVSVDYHCCIGEGALLYGYAYSESRGLPAADLARVQHFGGFLQKELRGSQLDTSPNLAGYAAIGTTIDYYYETYKTAAITYEGKYGGESFRLDAHRAAWGAILGDLATGMQGAAKPDVNVQVRGEGSAPAFAVSTLGAKSIKVCAGSNCIPMSKTLARGDREIRYDDATLAVPADGLMSAVIEQNDGKTVTVRFKVTMKS